MIRAAIVGGTGYGGMELLRLLLGHPAIEPVAVTSRSETGPVGDRHPHLRGFTDLRYEDVPVAELAAGCDLLFFATPHGVAAEQVPAALSANPSVRVIDLSGDHRLKDPALHARHYGRVHAHPESLEHAVYGLPECGGRRAVADARLVANPGCHATAALLALWPAVREGLARGRASVCSVTGSSGSGAKPGPGTHHPERCADFRAYRPLRHQHLPEIEQALAGHGTPAPPVDLVPHSAPFSRGIAVTAFVPVAPGREQAAAAAYPGHYEAEPFVRLLEGPPAVRAVTGSNLADLSVQAGEGVLCVMVAIDNLLKGMAGTAVQNANLLFELPETTGLLAPGIGP